jgi:hypothetical protein
MTGPVERRSRGAPGKRHQKRRRSSRVPGGNLGGTPRHIQASGKSRTVPDGSSPILAGPLRWTVQVLRIGWLMWTLVPQSLRDQIIHSIGNLVS